jgi:hypothetical protein
VFGFVILSFFFKRQIWRLWKECWKLELRVLPLGKGTTVGLWVLSCLDCCWRPVEDGVAADQLKEMMKRVGAIAVFGCH